MIFKRYFDESNLLRYPVYTYDLCKLECKIKAIFDEFDCIPFFYKKLPHEHYCNSLQMLLLEYYQCKVNLFQFQYRKVDPYHFKLHLVPVQEAVDECNCLEMCTDVKFGIHQSVEVYWIQGNKLQVELIPPKMRVMREVIYTFTDIMGENLSED